MRIPAVVGIWIKRNWALVVAFSAVFVAVVGFAWGLQQQYLAKQAAEQTKTITQRIVVVNNRHHQQNTAQQNEITTLLKEHSVTFAQQKVAAAKQAAYDADVLAFAETLAGQLKAVCASTHASCPVPPPIPNASP